MGLARIGLGSNVGDAAANVRTAIDALARLGRVTARSRLYRTKPWGVAEQADFVNAAVLLETQHEPRVLLTALKALERELGRRPSPRYGPRLIDLDILAYDDVRIDEPDLTVPHRRLRERAFALAPLAEVDPAFRFAYDALSREQRAGVVPLYCAVRRRRRRDVKRDGS